MINMIFLALMSAIANIIQFIIVFGILAFIFLLSFLLKGGWIFGIVLYGLFGLSFITFLIDKHNSARKNFENKLNERKPHESRNRV